jgi:hypothetical protein
VLDRDVQVARWIELTEQRRIPVQVEPKLSSRGRINEGRPESGTSAAARQLNIDETDAKRGLTIRRGSSSAEVS